jgi:hypothetical protein
VQLRITISMYSANLHVDIYIWSNALYIKYYAYPITYLAKIVLSSQQLHVILLSELCFPNPAWQISLWEETGAAGSRKPTSFGKTLADSLHMSS